MFDDVYDNGFYLLGKVENIRSYLIKIKQDKIRDEEDYSDIDDLLNEINIYAYDTILVINYENAMGPTIEAFRYQDKMEF